MALLELDAASVDLDVLRSFSVLKSCFVAIRKYLHGVAISKTWYQADQKVKLTTIIGPPRSTCLTTELLCSNDR